MWYGDHPGTGDITQTTGAHGELITGIIITGTTTTGTTIIIVATATGTVTVAGTTNLIITPMFVYTVLW